MQEVNIKPKNVIKYSTLPGFFPRLKTLFGGLNYLPYFLAIIYKNVGLIPYNHPYLDPKNQGRFGVVSLFSEAISNVKFDKENIDKVILLGLTLVGFVLFLLFGIGLVFSLLTPAVQAFGTLDLTMLQTAAPEEDVAFEVLDRIFGIPDVFNSNYGPIPTPFHSGLHSLIEFYNTALFIIAAFILLYYIFSIVGETAITGTLFGQRFHKVWGPLRIVIALGLLVPMGNYGLSSSQYILLYVAKYGSGLATNSWLAFNNFNNIISPFGTNATVNYTQPEYEFIDINGNRYNDGPFYATGTSYESNGLIVHPKVPDVSEIAGYVDLIYTCIFAYKQMLDIDIMPYFIDGNNSTHATAGGLDPQFATEFYGNNNIVVYFGHKSGEHNLPGNVKPYCGELVFPYRNETYIEIEYLRWIYYWIVMARFRESNLTALSGEDYISRHQHFANKVVTHTIGNKVAFPDITTAPSPCDFGNGYAVAIGDCADDDIEIEHRAYSASQIQRDFYIATDLTISLFIIGDQAKFGPATTDLNRGWATAGIWYNKIAEWNGDVVSAVSSTPYARKFPEILENVKSYKLAANPKTDSSSIFELTIDGTRDIKLDQYEKVIHRALLKSYNYWNADGGNDVNNKMIKASSFESGLASIFGLSPILTIRDQNHVHPLAQLSGIGRNLIENAVANLGLAFGASFIGGAMNAAKDPHASGFSGMSQFFVSIAYISILLGVVLYYIVPFMPFIYSFFAFSGWIKSIFEAMVGVPLWALSHLRLSGDMLIPQGSMSGYFLLLEIFIRPMLILFGLFATTAVFAASVAVLNSIWDIATYNMTGVNISNDPTEIAYYRNGVDQLFFLVLYIISVYMIATSCFKLIDQIPHSVIRWINAGVKSFGDMAKDPAEGLYQYASMATYRFAPGIGEAVSGMGEMAGSKSGLFSETAAPAATTGTGANSGVGGAVGASRSGNLGSGNSGVTK